MTSLSKDSDVPSIEEILDRGGSVSQIPPGALLHSMRESIQKTVLGHYKKRGEDSDRLLRELQKMRSQNQRNTHEREQKRERAPEKEGEERKHKLKKIKKREPDEDRPPAVGAHGVARQDGVDVHKGEPKVSSLAPRCLFLKLNRGLRCLLFPNTAVQP
jgi:transcriptional adapter 3